MEAKREFRDHADTEVAVLDALVDRGEGMTVFELRSHVAVGIDELEEALAALKADGLIAVETEGERTRIKPDERVVPGPGANEQDESFLDHLRERLGL